MPPGPRYAWSRTIRSMRGKPPAASTSSTVAWLMRLRLPLGRSERRARGQIPMHDLRHAVRQFLKSPGFTAVALLTLAIGIGASAAIFSVVNSVLLRPLAYPESDRLVVLQESNPPQFPEFAVAPGQYFEWQKES